jgi:hypothetical protein
MRTQQPGTAQITGTPILQDREATPIKQRPNGDDIALRAYAIWEERLQRNEPGSAEEDWYRAEREVQS